MWEIQENKRNLGIVLMCGFDNWVSVLTPRLIDSLLQNFDCYYISSQYDYNTALMHLDLDAILSFEPNWASPKLNYKKEDRNFPIFIYYSDPHKDHWREDYFLENDLDYVLTPYYHPFKYHFKKIPEEKIVHFPWAIPDDYVAKSKVVFHGDKKLTCFGSLNHEAYSTRRFVKQFDFVDYSSIGGVENPKLTDDQYLEWLRTKDVIIAAGSEDPKYRLTTPKYFEIAASGALLFAQWTEDLELLGFSCQNSYIFEEDNFTLHKDVYFNSLNNEEFATHFIKDVRQNGINLIKERHCISHRIELLQSKITEWYEKRKQ